MHDETNKSTNRRINQLFFIFQNNIKMKILHVTTVLFMLDVTVPTEISIQLIEIVTVNSVGKTVQKKS